MTPASRVETRTADVMGHRDIATTQRFTHLRPIHEMPTHARLAGDRPGVSSPQIGLRRRDGSSERLRDFALTGEVTCRLRPPATGFPNISAGVRVHFIAAGVCRWLPTSPPLPPSSAAPEALSEFVRIAVRRRSTARSEAGCPSPVVRPAWRIRRRQFGRPSRWLRP